jgi:hypothetical protein
MQHRQSALAALPRPPFAYTVKERGEGKQAIWTKIGGHSRTAKAKV